jgi:hypothetical protein
MKSVRNLIGTVPPRLFLGVMRAACMRHRVDMDRRACILAWIDQGWVLLGGGNQRFDFLDLRLRRLCRCLFNWRGLLTAGGQQAGCEWKG